MNKEHTYSNGDVTIVWKAHLCIHSRKCWKGLPRVFKPGMRPWITPDGAASDEITAQVTQCPSGALTMRTIDDPEHV
ncbi:MAG: (4Fe-4S)-binding protein [Flavobacteriales bacterium]